MLTFILINQSAKQISSPKQIHTINNVNKTGNYTLKQGIITNMLSNDK
jgi:hypothetical protein